jgi:type VI secretion system protein ImpK
MAASPTPPALEQAMRTNSLALVFQEVFTAVLRTRYQQQQVSDATLFRTHIRQAIQAGMQEARNIGYSSEVAQMAVFAMVGFLDESVLNSGNPAFSDWSRRPLQEELFGGHLAGETAFRNINDLLARQDSPEVADILELHGLCLLLGFRGRYALGDAGELYRIQAAIAEKIHRIRGDASVWMKKPPAEVRAVSRTDAWLKPLLFATLGIILLTGLSFAGLKLSEGSTLSSIQRVNAH